MYILFPMKIKVAVYTRVSTDNQAELEFNSCEAQEAKINAFISSQEGMEVFNVYSDPGYSGANLNRPAMSELLADIEQGKIDIVISYKIDRLTRSPKDFYHLIEIFDGHNVSFISVTERFDTSTPSGRLLRNIMLTFAQFERELTSERTSDKALERAKKGLYGGGVRPFGYVRANKKIIAEPTEAAIIRRIFETYIRTTSLFKTYEALKAAGIRKGNNRVFTKGDLFNLLRKPVYAGKILHNGTIYQGIHEPIISEEQFEQAQTIHRHKLVPKWHPAKPFLFPGLVKCKECGSTMTTTFTNKIKLKKRKRYYYYNCTSVFKKDWSACSTKLVSATRLEDFIIENFERISLDNLYLEGLCLKHKSMASGHEQGFELLDIKPEGIKETLVNVVEKATSKEAINKSLALRNYIQSIIYSKESIEIKLCLPAANACVSGGAEHDRRPKMPPPIFGRRTDQPEKNGAGADEKLGLAKVCSYKITGGQGFEPRYAAPEAAVLPLDDPPKPNYILSNIFFKTLLPVVDL